MQGRLLSDFGAAKRGGERTVAKASTRKKPISLYPLSFKEAVAALLKVEPPKDSKTADERSIDDRMEFPQA